MMRPLTDGIVYYKLGSDPAFEKCLPVTLQQEGGFSQLAHDRGGATMEGITQQTFDLWRRTHRLPTGYVRTITVAELRTIYHDWYWYPECIALPIGLALCVFDTNVNSGHHVGTILLQRTLHIHEDGIFGPLTYDAVRAIDTEELGPLVRAFCGYRQAYYHGLRDFAFFGRDWTRRNSVIERQALAQIGEQNDV